jgi:Flp pilus assembly protein TadD
VKRPWAAPSPAAAFLTAFVLLSAGCSLPRIIVLHDPLTAAGHNALGRVYEAQGLNDLALRQYREAFEQDPENCGSLMLLGELSYHIGDYAAAEQAYARALMVDPENGDARNNLAWVLIRSGRGMDSARELIRQALAVNPAHRAFYLDTLGVILLKQEKPAEAVAVLEAGRTEGGNSAGAGFGSYPDKPVRARNTGARRQINRSEISSALSGLSGGLFYFWDPGEKNNRPQIAQERQIRSGTQKSSNSQGDTMKILVITCLILLTLSVNGCEKPQGQNQQTPDSSPTTTSPMNPK